MNLKDKLAELWSSGAEPPDLIACMSRWSTESPSEILEALKFDQQLRWRKGRPYQVEEYLAILPDLPAGIDWRQELILGEQQAKLSAAPDTKPSSSDTESLAFAETPVDKFREAALPGNETADPEAHPELGRHVGEQLPSRQHAGLEAAPEFLQTMEVLPGDLLSGSGSDSSRSNSIGENARYRLDRILGEGACGRVYLGYDEVLRRPVAIKVPKAKRFRNSLDIEHYLLEAQTAAALEHPHVVPVYDAGRTRDTGCFVVSKFVDGEDLSNYSKRKLADSEIASLLAKVADALQHIHNCGLIHRDVKPANIIVDAQGEPHVTDFGLAVQSEEISELAIMEGTPAYMSPEQIRGEGHLLSGQSDIFSLGVVMYELLTRVRPFTGATIDELLRAIQEQPPVPPREIRPSVPAELERICLKSLSKRAADRYACAADLASDLRSFTTQPSVPVGRSGKVVPRGLQSFDAGDADFFLGLLPGPHDRNGIPEVLRFWKARVESTDHSGTFRTGIVYGPSGCGKSSLIKAGLLPRLGGHVQSVFVEATPDETAAHLLQGIRRVCPEVRREGTLSDTLSAIRRGKGLPAGRKLLLVIDQFEQLLNVNNVEQYAELIAAFRQCDGVRVQTLLLVRDDFWMPITEFCRALEVPMIEGSNALSVSLFNPEHARKVLAEFGVAYGCLPENRLQMTAEQHEFVRLAVDELSQDGKVICVRLALFAEMMKSRSWVPRELRAVGGTTGVGTRFLEETFSSESAPLAMRQHETAVRAVLNSLLPSAGSDIKGKRKTLEELREVSGYARQPEEFASLMRILSNDLRLITATGQEEELPGQGNANEGGRYYQLTHDYLIPSLRDWFSRRQRETKRGRAELRLEEQTAIWSARKELRLLPVFSDWLQIQLHTVSAAWTAQQRLMMSQATRYYRRRILSVVSGTLLVTMLSFAFYRQAAIERSTRLAAEFRESERRENQASFIEASLNRGIEANRQNDYQTAFAERQQLAALEVDLQDESLKRKISKFASEVDAVSEFEEARVRRCGMPSCQFDYVHFNPDNILKRLSLDFQNDASEELADAISDASIKEQIIAAVDDWTWVVSFSQYDSYRELLPKFIEVCNRVDANPVRVSVRNAVLNGDFSKFDEIIAAEKKDSAEMNATSLVFIANALERCGRGSEAVDLLLRGVEAYPGDFWMNLRLAELIRSSRGKSNELYLKHLEIARALRPENLVILSNLASEYMARGRHDEALRLMTQASKLDEEDAFVKHNIGIWHAEMGQQDMAETTYEAVLKQFPDFVPSHVNLSIIKYLKGEKSEAMRLVQRALVLQRDVCDRYSADAGDRKNLAQVIGLQATYLYDEGKAAEADKVQAEAITLLRTASERDLMACNLLQDQLLKSAEWAEERGNVTQEIRLLKEAAALNSTDSHGVALWKLASAYARNGTLDKALDYISQASASLPPANELAANILLNAAIFHSIKFGEVKDSFEGDGPVPDTYARKAVDFLRMAHARNYFAKVEFAMLLSQQPELEPLQDEFIFWAFVVEVFQDGFKETPDAWDDFNTPAAYLSARAALLAADAEQLGPSDVPAEFRRAQLRGQAYKWILPGLRSTWKVGEDPANEPKVQATLSFWLEDPILKPVRDDSAMERLPESERSVWQEFWQAVRSRKDDSRLPFPSLSSTLIRD